MGAQVLIEACGLRKSYGTFTAVDGIDLEVRRAESFGVLGANGAGKSSTMRMIGCVSPLSGGTLRILGRDAGREGSAIRARLGVVSQDDTLDIELTVRENLLIYGRYFGLPRPVIRERAERLLEFARLTDKAGERVGALSKILDPVRHHGDAKSSARKTLCRRLGLGSAQAKTCRPH